MASQIKSPSSIKANSLFKNIEESKIDFKPNQKNFIEVSDGNIIFQVSDPADELYLIVDGEVKIKLSTPIEGRRIFIKTKNEFFGEKELLENTPRTSSAVAQTACTLYVIGKKELDNIISKNKAVNNNLKGLEQNQNITDEDTIVAPPEEQIEDFNLPFAWTPEKELETLSNVTKEIPAEKTESESTEIIQETGSVSKEMPPAEDIKTEIIDDKSVKSETIEEEKLSDVKEEESDWDYTLTSEEEIKGVFDWDFSNIIEEPGEEISPETVDLDFLDETETKPIENKKEPEEISHYFIPKEEDKKGELTKEQLKTIIDVAGKVNSNILIDEVLRSISDAAASLTIAERGMLYIVNSEEGIIWSKVFEGDFVEDIMLNIGEGLVGWTAKTGEIVNIKNALTDQRFNSDIDKLSDYEIKSMLCFPIKNKDGIIIGVLQLLNNLKGEFTEIDEKILEALSISVAIAIENAGFVQQLLRDERSTALDRVAGFIINDLKKPILIIKQLVEHIRKKDLPQDILLALNMILEQASFVSDVVQTTLGYAEGNLVLQTKVQSLCTLLDEILELLADYVENKNVKFFKKYERDVLVNADKRELYQAFYQITKNACDAMIGGGNFYVTTSIEGDFVKISFKDTGLGISEGLKNKIFEPYVSQSKSQGIGLGLPIVEKIIKEHHGTITFESVLGEGTNFIISLPIYQNF